MALSFDGDNDYVSIAGSVSQKTAGTIAFWLKAPHTGADGALGQVDSTDNVNSGVFGRFASGTLFGIYPHNTVGGQGFTYISETDTNALFDNQWHYVVICWTTSASSTQVWIDGVQKSVTQWDGYTTKPYLEGNFRLGSRRDGYAFFSGLIQNFRLYDRALSGQEIITSMYRRASAEANVVGIWRLDEQADAVAHDFSQNCADGALGGPTWAEGYPILLGAGPQIL